MPTTRNGRRRSHIYPWRVLRQEMNSFHRVLGYLKVAANNHFGKRNSKPFVTFSMSAHPPEHELLNPLAVSATLGRWAAVITAVDIFSVATVNLCKINDIIMHIRFKIDL